MLFYDWEFKSFSLLSPALIKSLGDYLDFIVRAVSFPTDIRQIEIYISRRCITILYTKFFYFVLLKEMIELFISQIRTAIFNFIIIPCESL